ncbi:Mpo1-like protein [Melghirimyces algeriensis]|uniref:Uncharacterized membrane protein YGL010W n=1 Tax=Melghirimyces algeriensis TaxID=910412 RepID=A0A521B8D4_9BACL|nr:DUF962 domain-containing protein [Melghirimyces algeriensis]SMO43382.1 Uncharacterized membrane protein YGL010W [Melghirimyces algeriensis]
MKFSDLFEQYKKDHQHPLNQLTHAIGIPMIVVSLPLFFFNWAPALILFILGWVLQLIGHMFEGKKPSFFRNPIFLIVGPWWWLRKRLGKSEDHREDHHEDTNH